MTAAVMAPAELITESSEDENYTILTQLAKVYKGYTREQRRQLGPKLRELGLIVAKPDEQPAEPGMNDSEDEDSLSVTIGDFARIKTAWRGDFFGDSITVFQSVVGNAQKRFNLNTDYAKFMPIVQSSVMGKLRLIDEYSKFSAGVIFTLRIEINRDIRRSTAHATVVGLLSAVAEEHLPVTRWILFVLIIMYSAACGHDIQSYTRLPFGFKSPQTGVS
ncbi:hypothetical protein FN846DRAFT_921275 [Sphaerosporella brunnea]|uniref:Uncharacterized protein n=1 Tax=Sphaerosporella brunnea TaxID=1250544 RepID=A0A5J5EN53_9PEZI|nr:hypothetical protein FN846DRAFT_921275 [Sphaerosporella brunnea]